MAQGFVDSDVLPVDIGGRQFQVLYQRYNRSLLQAQRPSVDQSQNPGESSVNPEAAWPRSGTDWSLGGGQEVRDDADGQASRYYRQLNTQAVRRGRIQLSNRLQQMSTTRGGAFFSPAFLPWTERLVVQTGNSLFWWEFSSPNYTLYRQSITAGPYGGAIAPATAVAASATTTLVLATDGTNRTWLARGATGVTFASTEAGAWSSYSTVPTNLVIYANGHLLGVAGNTLWEIDSGGLKVGGADIFDHPNTSWIWQGGVAGAGRIYLWGNAGNDAAVYVLYDVLSSTGTLAPPKIALPLPPGEVCQHLEPVGGVFLMRTNLGLRLVVPNGDSLDMGPLILHRDQATDAANIPTCVSAAAGDYVMVAFRNPSGQPDFIGRVDLSRFVAENQPVLHPIEYTPPDGTPANNGIGPIKVVNRTDTQFQSGQLWVWGGTTTITTRRVWAVTLNGAPNSDGTARQKAAAGYFDTGWLTWGTTDPKQPVSIRLVFDPLAFGQSIVVDAFTEDGTIVNLGFANTVGSTSHDLAISAATLGPRRQLRLRISLNIGTDATLTPALDVWQCRAFVQPIRPVEVILPIILKDQVQASGRGPRVPQDVLFDYQFLVNLAKAGTVITLRELGLTGSYRVDNVTIADEGSYREHEGRMMSRPIGPSGRWIQGIYYVRCLEAV